MSPSIDVVATDIGVVTGPLLMRPEPRRTVGLSRSPGFSTGHAGNGAPMRRRLAPLDGMRGVAVAAGLLFHADVAWARGGFLGVDFFFVLSGYLITSLLLEELGRTGRIDLPQFWLRRARRLLPALFVLVAVGVALAPVLSPLERIADVHDDALATIGQVANWRLVDTVGTVLVGSVRSPFQHCWSLAIEMQFYALWPLVVIAFAAGGRARRDGRLEVGAVAAVLA